MAYRLAPGATPERSTASGVGEVAKRERVLVSSVQRLYRHPGWTLAANAAAVLACTAGYWAASGDPQVLVWAVVLLASLLPSVLLVLALRRAPDAVDARARTWLRRFNVALAINAVAWGAAVPWLRPPADAASTWLLIVVLMIVAGTGSNLVAVQRSATVSLLALMLVPPAAYLLAQPTLDARGLGAIVFAFLLLCAVLADSQRRLFERALHARLDIEAFVAALRRQVDLVEQANREKSRFLASASHDLRQPMHALGLFAATLQKQLGGSPLQVTVTQMLRSIDALDQSFNAMLDISKLDAGVIEPNLQAFPIRDLFRVLHLQCMGAAEERGLSLRFKPGGKIVTSDPHLLGRVLGNLIHNAIRYTRAGGVVVVARTRVEGTSLEVWDTGIGIAEDDLPRVFDEFYQVGNPGRDRGAGLGMGLAIVKRLVLLMGHTLEVASRPGRGTVFRVLLKPTELAEMRSVVLGAETVPPEISADRTVLLIDDEQSILSGMSELLAGWGYLVLTASTIAEACAAVRRHGDVIDIVVSDLRLAHAEDGIHAIERVRAVYGAPLPALLITGDTSAEEVKRAHDSGHQVLFKPVRTRELYAALRATP